MPESPAHARAVPPKNGDRGAQPVRAARRDQRVDRAVHLRRAVEEPLYRRRQHVVHPQLEDATIRLHHAWIGHEVPNMVNFSHYSSRYRVRTSPECTLQGLDRSIFWSDEGASRPGGAGSIVSKAHLKKLARGIVLAQGNRYIKEFLRKHDIRIGTTKAEFQRNLILAIDEGALTEQQLDTWLVDVEGWGNQHVYLFGVPRGARRIPPAELRRRARRGKLFDASPSLAFPAQRELTGIYCDDESFQLLWHEGFEAWIRAKDRDYRQEDDTDIYEYRAYREQPKRSVMRFEWPFGDDVAAAFLQIPWNEDDHNAALQEIWQELRGFGFDRALAQISLDELIRALDESDAPEDDVTVQSTSLSTPGARVDFASTIPGKDYKESEAVAAVHRAVEHREFGGERGVFVFKSDNNGITRNVKIQMYGASNRIRFWAQCTKSDVWSVLRRIVAAR